MAKNVLIIGGGIVGLAIAREVAQLHNYEIFVYEKEPVLGEHASGRHNGVNHSGIYYPNDSLKAKLSVLGNWLNWQYFPRWNVPCKPVGKYIVALNEKEDKTLDNLLENAEQNGVPGVQKLSGGEVQRDDSKDNRIGERQVHCYSAVYVPTAGVFDGAVYIQRLESLVRANGVHIAKRIEVFNIEKMKEGFKIFTRETSSGKIEQADVDIVINAAGLSSGSIAGMINPENEYEIIPVRGEGAYFNRRPELEVHSNIYPVPQEHLLPDGTTTFTTGVHLSPTLQGTETGRMIIVSPILVNPKQENDYKMTTPLTKFYDCVVPFFRPLNVEDLEYYQSGISAKLEGQRDFFIERDKTFLDCIHLLGIDSPGVTAALAIGVIVKQMILNDYGIAQEYFQKHD